MVKDKSSGEGQRRPEERLVCERVGAVLTGPCRVDRWPAHPRHGSGGVLSELSRGSRAHADVGGVPVMLGDTPAAAMLAEWDSHDAGGMRLPAMLTTWDCCDAGGVGEEVGAVLTGPCRVDRSPAHPRAADPAGSCQNCPEGGSRALTCVVFP
jgi:hypothetical protein